MKAGRALVFVTLALLAASTAASQPVVRVVIRQKPPFLAGQQVEIDVQLYVPNFFMSPPKFPPTLDVPGAVVAMPDESGINLNETINGESYAGIQKTYVFAAQSPGRYTLPPAAIPFRYAAEPGKPTDASVRLPATVIEIVLPKGVAPPSDGGAGTLVATIAVEQTLDGDPATLKVGDALTRTTVIIAGHTQAMFIPPPRFTAPAGVRVYQKDPVLSDQREDRVGLVAGRRTDRVVYTFDRAGAYVLPPVEVPWFDTRTNRQRIARTPEIAVSVRGAAASPGIAPEPEPERPPAGRVVPYRRIAEWGALIAVAFVAMVVFWRPAVRAVPAVLVWGARGWDALRRDRATHLPPLNPV